MPAGWNAGSQPASKSDRASAKGRQKPLNSLIDLRRFLPEYHVSGALNYHLGVVLFKSGQKQEARDKLEKALGSNEPFDGREEAEKLLANLK